MKNKLVLQVILTFSATFFSIYTIYNDFLTYNLGCGSILPTSSKLTHPFFTPCFYGGFAFVLTAILASLIFRSQKIKLQKSLLALSIFGTAFAYSNMILEFRKYINVGMTTYKGCSGAIVQNPFFTPCFTGSVLFTLIMLLSAYIYKKLKI